MAKKSSVQDSILKGLQEAVAHKEGKLKAKTTKITIKPAPDIKHTQVKKLRQHLALTQSVFATLMGVSQKTVEAWEAGTNHPSGSAKRMMELLMKDDKLPERYGLIDHEKVGVR